MDKRHSLPPKHIHCTVHCKPHAAAVYLNNVLFSIWAGRGIMRKCRVEECSTRESAKFWFLCTTHESRAQIGGMKLYVSIHYMYTQKMQLCLYTEYCISKYLKFEYTHTVLANFKTKFNIILGDYSEAQMGSYGQTSSNQKISFKCAFRFHYYIFEEHLTYFPKQKHDTFFIISPD
jgi:hypothetical protein